MLGNCAMLMDAECYECYCSFPPTLLPVELQTSRPDIVLLENVRGSLCSLPAYNRRDPRIHVHLVEVGYTADFALPMCMHRKQAQHAQLLRNMQAYGWQVVSLHTFVIGHSGVMLAHNAGILTCLGVPFPRVRPFLAGLAIDSLRKSCAILSQFPSLKENVNAIADSAPGSLPDAPSPHDGLPQASAPSEMPTPHALPLPPQLPPDPQPVGMSLM